VDLIEEVTDAAPAPAEPAPADTTPDARYETRVVKLAVLPKNAALYNERATLVGIQDEAAGEFIVISQPGSGEDDVRIDPEEWPHVRAAIDRLVQEARK
jgi:hypothetical protein